MAIAYKSAGAGGGTETSGAQLALACPAVVAANDILIGHVTHEGLTTAPTDPAGWTLLYGPANLGTGTAIGRSWAYGKLADGTEDGATINFGTAGGTAGRYGRIYSFDGWVAGTIGDVVPAASFTDTATEGSIPLPTVTTTLNGAMAVALLVQDDNNAFAAAGAVTGGTWAEPVAEFVSTSLGVQGCIVGIQTSIPTGNPGTITGGTANATADEGSTIGFEIRPNGVGFSIWNLGYTNFNQGVLATPNPMVINHVGGTTTRGVLVFVGQWSGTASDRVVGITYGGVAMTRIGRAVDTAGEIVAIYCYFLGASIPTGTQEVAVTHDGTSDSNIGAQVFTVTAYSGATLADTAVVASGVVQEDQANPQVALDSGAGLAVRYGELFSGHNSAASVVKLSGMTDVEAHWEQGTLVQTFGRQTSPSTGSFTMGYTATSEDVAYVAVAVGGISGTFPLPSQRVKERRMASHLAM